MLVASAVVAGVAMRVFLLRSPLFGGYLDSDEAVPGLMARHFLQGEPTTFYWGAAYGGTAEVGLVAAIFAVAGSGEVTLRLAPIVLYALGALLVWRIGRRLIGEPAATVAGLLVWLSPAYFVFKSTREYGYQQVLLVLGLAIVLLALRLAERVTKADCLGLGLSLGLGWWTSVQIALVALPVLAWLTWRRPQVWRLGWLIAAGAFVGAFPWLFWNLRNDWASLRVGSSLAGSYGSRLVGFFVDALPGALGFRVPWMLDWLPDPTSGKVLFGIVAATLAVVLFQRRHSLELVIAVALPYPFIYAASSFTAYRFEPRYLVLLAPLLALPLATLLVDARVAAVGLAAAAALAVSAFARMSDAGGIPSIMLDEPPSVSRIDPLLRTLERQHVTRAWADYWIAFRVTFLTRERIVVAPTYDARYPRYNELVEQSPRSARIFIAGSRTEQAKRPMLLQSGFRPIRTGAFVVYVPAATAPAEFDGLAPASNSR